MPYLCLTLTNMDVFRCFLELRIFAHAKPDILKEKITGEAQILLKTSRFQK